MFINAMEKIKKGKEESEFLMWKVAANLLWWKTSLWWKTAHEQKPEKENNTHLRNRHAGKELANANVLRDDYTEWVQERIKVSVAGE